MVDRLKAIEEKRARLQAETAAAADEQLAADLEAIYEIEQGMRIGLVKMAYVAPGTPVRAAARAAKEAEVKRFRATARSNKRGEVDATSANDAAAVLGATCQVYPERDSEADKAMREAHPDCRVALGLLAIKLAGAEEVDEGKD
jgi:hypothetical protein